MLYRVFGELSMASLVASQRAFRVTYRHQQFDYFATSLSLYCEPRGAPEFN